MSRGRGTRPDPVGRVDNDGVRQPGVRDDGPAVVEGGALAAAEDGVPLNDPIPEASGGLVPDEAATWAREAPGLAGVRAR
ncbi:MAG TPA: hypothetical protein VFW33_05265, partial [Gemmataceae bacterium]|nr:hypothetical protein [Gemmataceae bacterium]